jgi:hypothetical protein
MFKNKIFKLIFLTFIFLTIVIVNYSIAEEKVMMHGTVVTTKYNLLEVDDEDGHVIAVTESKQVHFNKATGEKFPQVSKVILDFNYKTGQGTLKSYAVMTSPSGDKIFTEGKGSPVGKGHWKGTYVYIKGTGKYEGIKGKGTWETQSLAPQISYMESEGIMELTNQ